MSDYKKAIKEEARSFWSSVRDEYAQDDAEHGGHSDRPNLGMWLDRTEKLARRIEEVASGWTHKDFLWVRHNTRNPAPDGGGDPRSNAFVSYLKDVRHELKKLAKGER